MKKAFLIVLAAMMAISANAQKKTVALGKVDAASGVGNKWAAQLKQDMMSGLAKSARLNLFDESNLSNLSGSSQDRLVKMKEEYHVDYLITATITSLTHKYSSKDGNSVYSATMEYTTTVTDTGTGEAISVVSEKDYGSSSKNSEEAYKNCFGLISAEMRSLVEECFPLEGSIQMVEESHPKKGAKTVFIDLGSALGLAPADYMDVYKIREMAGREIPTNIGTLRCKEVVAEDLSLCTVKKGGVEIQKALDNDEKLVVKTRKRSLTEF
jgi:hypothetical protein